MATRSVTGRIVKSDGSAWPGALVQICLARGTFTASPAQTLPAAPIAAVTDQDGRFAATLVAGLDVPYRITLPDRSSYLVVVPAGGPAYLEVLRAGTFDDPGQAATVQPTLLALYGSPPTGRAPVVVKEGGTTRVAEAIATNYDGAAFDVSASPTDQANISLAYGTAAGQPAAGNHTHPASALDDLSDVTITAGALGEVLRHNGTAWVDSAFRIVTGSATWNPPSLLTGQIGTTLVPVPGVAASDSCFAGHTQVAGTNLTLHAIGDSADQARVVLQNTTASTVDIASGTVRVVCFAGV